MLGLAKNMKSSYMASLVAQIGCRIFIPASKNQVEIFKDSNSQHGSD